MNKGNIVESKKLALELYESGIKERQKKPDFEIPKTKDDLKRIRLENFETQLAKPRKNQLYVKLRKTVNRIDRKIQYLFLVALIVSPMLIMPLSMPIMANMVVVMYHDDAVDTAVRNIEENVPNAIIVEYGSIDYLLNVHRVIGQIAWVSHGSDEGIMTSDGLLSWDDFSYNIARTPSRDIILACKSDNIYNYVNTISAVGINGIIDATLGGLLVSYLFEPQNNILEATIFHILEIVSGEVEIVPLSLSTAEWTYWLAIFILSILAYYTGTACAANPTWVQWTVWFIKNNAITNSPAIVYTIVYFILGQIDLWTAVWQIIGFVIFDLPVAFSMMMLDPNILTDPLFIITIAAAAIIFVAHIYYGWISLDMAFFLTGTVFILAGAVTDLLDNNDWVG